MRWICRNKFPGASRLQKWRQPKWANRPRLVDILPSCESKKIVFFNRQTVSNDDIPWIRRANNVPLDFLIPFRRQDYPSQLVNVPSIVRNVVEKTGLGPLFNRTRMIGPSTQPQGWIRNVYPFELNWSLTLLSSVPSEYLESPIEGYFFIRYARIFDQAHLLQLDGIIN